MASLSPMLKEVVRGITPTARPPEVERLVAAINRDLKKRGTKAEAHIGGSFAKDTWLVGDHDVDIFVAFDLRHKDDNLSDLLEKALRPLLPRRVHGSRDYFQIDDHFTYEIIPVLAIKKASDAQNITDFSLKHVAWVNARSRKLKDDIRLAKKFCKAQRVYGAESYIRGFSGHVVDLLVIHHGGFLPLLRAARRWTPKTVIDPVNAHNGKALLALNRSKTEGPLVLVDPVQPDRNAAASLTLENYNRFITAAGRFLDAPDARHFERAPLDFTALAKKGALVKVRATPTEGSDDIAGTRLLKLFEHARSALTAADFTVMNAAWEWTAKDALLWYVTKERLLPATRRVDGPPVALAKHAAAFRKKHRKTTVFKGRLVATIARKECTPDAVVRRALRDAYATEKTAGARIVR